MGFVILEVLDDIDTQFKLWVDIKGKSELGETGAEEHVRDFLDWLADDRLVVTQAKVSTDAQAVLVVYLAYDLAEADDDVWLLAERMKTWSKSSSVRLGWSHVAGSEILCTF
jgi:hypothetical protein